MPPAPSASGPLLAFAAFLSWGLLPAYWKALSDLPALEILCHRIVWSLAAVLAALLWTGRLAEARRALTSPREVLLLAASSALIAANWFLFIWAVNAGHVLEASLGYYVNPLVNVLLGRLFLRERLRRVQAWAVALAGAGVLVLLVVHGRLPWIALSLAATFALYGLVRKVMAVEALPGLFVETLVLGLPAGAWLLWLAVQGQGALGHAPLPVQGLALGAGLVTAAPLAAFAAAARSLRLATLGIIQYVSPTGMFLLGVLAYGEPFTPAHAATFGLIWAGIALYTRDVLGLMRAQARGPARS